MIAVTLASLGICEHCGALTTTWDVLTRSDNGWNCIRCHRAITKKTFGYNADGSRFGWVGPDGKWTIKKPEEDFRLGEWDIIVLNGEPALSG